MVEICRRKVVGSGAMADVLELLIAERDRLDQAIAVLEGPRRRGRPPGSGKEVAAKKVRTRPGMSAEARKRRSEGMKKWWTAHRKAAKKTAKKSS